MGVVIDRKYSCDSCGRELAELDAMYAHLPHYHSGVAPPIRMRVPGGGVVRAGHDGIYCSWDCVRQAVEEFAALVPNVLTSVGAHLTEERQMPLLGRG